MKNIIPKAAAINDLSGIGRCSLAVALPILSCLGVQCVPIPTAVLSTQTGGFDDYHFVDLTDDMPAIMAHYRRIPERFDCIYSGFLGSVRQIDMVSEFIREMRQADTLVVVDPVMGDDGCFYSVYDEEMAVRMRELVRVADLITPNLTEAALLLGRPMPKSPLSELEMRQWARELCALGPSTGVITGVLCEGGGNCVAAWEEQTGQFYRVDCDYLPCEYPGTGDIFASVLTGMLLARHALLPSLRKAAQFVHDAIRETYLHQTPAREGIVFEKVLHTLLKESCGEE